MSCNRVKRTARWPLAAFLFVSLAMCSSAATLDDLKKLDIICFVPSYLPQGSKLKALEITYDDVHEEFDDINHRFPLYSVEYGNDENAE
jgi:hypothetical protein